MAPKYLDKLAPIVLFVYNRPEHTKRTVESLLKNINADKSSLLVYSDGPKNDIDADKVRGVRNYVRGIKGFQKIEIVQREKNFGLANSVITGINDIFNSYDCVIALEDDVITAPLFLNFMNSALEFYQDDFKIFSVSGYPYPIKIPNTYTNDVFISYRTSSWGWGTWKDRWERADWELKDFDTFIMDKKSKMLFNRAGEDLTQMLIAQKKGEIDSWAIRWSYTHFNNNAYCLYPVRPLCKNIGTDSSGTHSSSSKKLTVELDQSVGEFILTKNLQLHDEISKEIQKLFKPTIFRKIINSTKIKLSQ